MLQPRLPRSSLMPSRDASVNLHTLAQALNTLTLCSKHSSLQQSQLLPLAVYTSVRHASHAAQGRANGPKDSAGRRLGAKKASSEYVIPGNIIFRQRGTKWFPGENVAMGKDHTIYATEYGFVRYYRNPAQHAKRRYIGVALEKEGPGSKLPTPPNAPTRRRLGMYAAPITIQNDEDFMQSHLSSNSKGSLPSSSPAGSTSVKSKVWPTNYEIGQAGDANRDKVRDYDRKDRWLAWRKRTKRVKESMLARAAKANRKTKGKKVNKGVGGPVGSKK